MLAQPIPETHRSLDVTKKIVSKLLALQDSTARAVLVRKSPYFAFLSDASPERSRIVRVTSIAVIEGGGSSSLPHKEGKR